MNLNQQIKSYINQHKKTKKRLSLAALLSLLTTMAVVSSLIMPAVSMTLSNAVGMNIGENSEIYMAANPGTPSTINGMLDLMSADVFIANLSSGGNNFYEADETGVKTNNTFTPSSDPVEISAYIEYSFTQSVKSYLTGSGPHLCWDLGNPNLTATFTDINGNPASNGVVTDPRYQNGQAAAGTYIIENGCVKVTLTEGYLNYVNEGDGTLKGALEFSGSLGSSGSEDGDQTFNINGQEITVDFPDKYPTITKNGSPDYSSGSFDNKVNWEINIASQTNSSLAGYCIEDANIPDSGVVLDPSEYTLVKDGNRWKIEGNSSAPALTIKYQTDAQTGQNSNTAKLYKDDKEIGQSSKDVNYATPVTVDKSSGVDTNDGQVDWTIVVSNPNKLDLTGFTLTDDMLSSALSGTFSISPEVGSLSENTITFNESSKNAQWITIKYSTEITAEQLQDSNGSTKTNTAIIKKGETEISKDSEKFNIEVNPFEVTKKGTPDYQNGNYDKDSHKIKWVITVNSKSGVSLDNYIIEDANIPESGVTVSPSGSLTPLGNGQWKLSGTNGANTVTITYEADAAEQINNTNEANLKYPNGDDTGKKGSDSVYYKSESELVSLGKSGYYNNSTHEINWTIDVNVEGGFNLNGYEITDSKFPESLDDLTFEPSNAKEGASLSGGKLTFGSYSGNVKIKYKTKVDMPQVTTTIDVSNDYGHNGTTQTATVQVPVRDQMTKSLSGSWAESIESSGDIVKVLNWNADIIHDGTFSGLTYTDDLTLTGSNASHTITDAQIAAIKITAGVASTYEKTLTIGTDYTVTKKDDGTGFTITFKDTLDNDGINFVRISYSTTAKADSVGADASYPIKYTFENGAGFNSNNSSGKFELTRNDPVIDERMDFNINKEWKSFPNISAAEFRILYTTDGGSTWNYVRKDSGGGYLFDGDSGYSSADYYTVTVNPSGTSGTVAVTNLPQTIRKANPDGSAGTTVNYKYKIAEVVNGSEITGNLVNDGSGNVYEVTYNNNYGIGYSGGTINVTNTYYTSRSITPKKNWTGDDGSGNGIDSVTVQLEYSVGSGYYPVKRSENGEYIFDNSSTDENVVQNITSGSSWIGSEWSNLPQKIVVNGNAVNCDYRIRETAYTLSGSSEPLEITNDRFILSDGYYEVSSGSGNDGNLTVTNRYVKTQNVSFSAVKSWAGDNSYLDGRPAEIYVQLTQYSSDGTNTAYGDLVKLSADNNWSYTWNELPNQSITDGKLITYSYKAAEVQYKFGENIVDITGSYFASTDSGWYTLAYNYQNDKTQITNTFTPVSTISITPQKKWVDDSDFASANRPQNVTLKLQRKLEGGSWEDCVDSDSKVITVMLSSSDDVSNEWTTGVLWQGASIDNLPETVITIDADGKYTKKSCVYRLVESAYKSASGSDVTLADDAVSFKTENGSYTITPDSNVGAGTHMVANTFKESIGITKSVIDSQGRPLSTIDVSDLSQFKKTIDQKEYYVFNWMIEYDSTKTELITPIEDTLPEGFTLCRDSSVDYTETSILWSSDASILTPIENGYYKSPCITWPGQGVNYIKFESSINAAWQNPKQSPSRYYYDSSLNKIYFGVPSISTVPVFTYSIKIECDKLDAKVANGSYSITNTAERYSNEQVATGQTDSATLKIANPVETNLLTKTYSGKTYIPGEMKFTMNVNPEGKNLSTGDTIDIEDIFDTVSYFDSDVGGGTLTTGSKLTDVIMSNIRLYEIDANDNRIELKPNQYSLMFENGSDVSGGSALLKLTIPDEKHIEIEYVYKIIANENTPSVINQCKSSTRVNGRYVTMTPGLVPPANDKVTFSNKAKLISDSATDESEVKNQEYVVSKSSGTISTDILPKIKKVNTGDYTINALSASFLFAKYENGKWYYATEITDGIVTWSSSGNDGTKISDDALKIDVQTAYEVELDETVLYKLVEVSVPDGYEGSNLGLSGEQFQQLITQYLNSGNPNFNGINYQRFLDNYVSTYYFAYNSVLNNYPSGITSADVMQIKSGGDIEIPNNELIDIGITKEWVKAAADVTDSEVTVELYWSYTKDSTKIPDDASLASADDLGIMSDDFTPIKTVLASANNAKLWTDLPNGKNSKPIYYYVKETGFKLGGTEYVLDTETGEYKSQSGDVISIKPTYSGNAANSDKVIGIRNSESLLLKKEWKNSANEPMKNIPVSKVVVSIYGIDSTGTKTSQPLFEDVEILAANDWTKDITELLGSVDLSEYKAFVAEESTGSSLDGYVVSCVFNLNMSTGEIIVTNKNKTATEASVSVNKVWSDGNDVHANESIKVTLYQSLQKLDDLTNLASKLNSVASVMQKTDLDDPQTYENVILNAENDWSVTWTGLPLEDEDQNRYYYYVLEDKSGIANADKYSESYSITSQTVSKTDYTITNTRNAIVVQKNWFDEDSNTVPDNELPVSEIVLDVLKKVPSVPSTGIKLVAFGDSITDGYGSSEPNCSKNGKDYPSKLV
ncbi:MAG: Cna B-type domain-containing protein, partial [Ruminococcus sp.]